MSDKGIYKEALADFVQRKAKVIASLVCTVDSYDSTTKTCYCIPVGDFADIQQVKVTPDGNGNFTEPKVNSTVIVSFLSDSSAFISHFSTFEEMHLGGDQYFGLAKTESLKTKLNNLENKVNNILTAIGTTWVPIPNDGGASLKLLVGTTLAATTLAPLTPTVRADIENDKIKHGNGTT